MILGATLMLSLQWVIGLSIVSFVIPNIIITCGVGLVLGTSAGLAMSQFSDNAGMVAAAFGVIVYGFSGCLGLIVTSMKTHHALGVGLTMLVFATLCLVMILTLFSKQDISTN